MWYMLTSAARLRNASSSSREYLSKTLFLFTRLKDTVSTSRSYVDLSRHGSTSMRPLQEVSSSCLIGQQRRTKQMKRESGGYSGHATSWKGASHLNCDVLNLLIDS
jgi:hypothetical protein